MGCSIFISTSLRSLRIRVPTGPTPIDVDNAAINWADTGFDGQLLVERPRDGGLRRLLLRLRATP